MKKTLLLLLLVFCTLSYSQSRRIKILQADNTFTDPKYPDATISLGNVFVEHKGATLRCDKAYIYQEKQFIKAMGNVIVNQGDTIHQYSKHTHYDGLNNIVTSWGEVLLKDELMTLETDTLKFDRAQQKLFYKTGGKIKDTVNVLTSTLGTYYLKTNKFEAHNNVVVTNKESKLNSNHLEYYTSTGIADLFGPSTIISDNNTIYTEKGHYNSKTHISHFLDKSKIYYDDRIIKGDSLYYNKNKEFASATGNVKLIDTLNNFVAKGGYAEMFKSKDSVFITDKAVAISKMETDSIYIHGEKLMVTGKTKERFVKAFHKVKFFKSDLQGKCDSLVSNEKIGLTEMFKNPVIWAQGNQITGDTIHLISNNKTEQLDSLKIINNGFLIQKDSAGFSQLKGKNMFGKFAENKLKSLDVIGNSEVIFYARNEQQALVGITKMQSSKNIFISFENNEISTIDFISKPDGKTYPPSEFPETEEKFKGFIWRENERPINKEAIFIQDKIIDSKLNNLKTEVSEINDKVKDKVKVKQRTFTKKNPPKKDLKQN